MRPSQSSLSRSHPFSILNLTIQAFFLTLLIAPVRAVPIRLSNHQLPDLWAQLLRANRFKLIPSPTWVTRGTHATPQLNSSHSEPSLSDSHQPHLDPSFRQKTYQSQRARSKFVCHVFNPPTNLNIDAVISRVLIIASQAWTSEQEVLMKVHFRDLGQPSVLANGGGTYFVQMADTFETVLPVAAAEAVRQQDLNGNEPDDGKYDVIATVNVRTPWYDGVDGQPPQDRYDLITVLLHEIYHNIVFAGSVTASYERIPNSNNAIQSADVHRGYLTRFDSFLKNEDDCAVLGYLTDNQLSQQLNRPPAQLLADAVCNDKLFWGYGPVKVAKLYSPRIFQNKSSIYHLDPIEGEQNSLMWPTVRIGSSQHTVGPKILEMQRISLDPTIPGANTGCPRPLKNPTPTAPIQPVDYQEPAGLYDGNPLVIDNRYREEGRRRIAGLPIWAFALLIVFAILLALLLLGLCLALLLKLLRRKRKPSYTSSSSSSSFVPGTKQSSRTKTSSTSSRPVFGGSVSKSKKTSTSSSSKLTTSVQPTSKHTGSSRHTSEPKPVTKRYMTCPSSGKSKYLCCCKCCRSSITAPEPIASVHTFDPASVPTCRKHKSTHKSTTHKHTHTCHKTIQKTCKSKSSKSCSGSCYCCRYKPSTCKTTTTCCKSSSKASSSRCPPSTKPPTTKATSTKVASSSKHCCSSKHCKSKSSSKSCSCSKSVTKVPSTKPPSTKPSTTKVASSSKSCRTCKSSCRTCKPSGNGYGCGCNRCQQVVEINIC